MTLRLRVKMRLWLASALRRPRERLLSRGLLERVHRGARQRSCLVCTNGWRSFIRAIRAPLYGPVATGGRGGPVCRRGATSASHRS
jgi:hypothetical protein